MAKFGNIMQGVTSGFSSTKASDVKVGDQHAGKPAESDLTMTDVEKAEAQRAAAEAAAKADAEAAAEKAAAKVEAEDAGAQKLPEFMVVGRDQRDPFQNLWFREGVPTPSAETGWVKCQVEAGILKRC